jgi:hypothetical protein
MKTLLIFLILLPIILIAAYIFLRLIIRYLKVTDPYTPIKLYHIYRKKLYETIRMQFALAAYDCDGMCNHCPEKYRNICLINKNKQMETKTLKIIADAQRDNIPIFVLTAKDKLSIEAIEHYWSICDLDNCEPAHIVGVQQRINDFQAWQSANPDKVKLPD